MCVVKGTLKGYDALMNLVMDDTHETVRGMCTYKNISTCNCCCNCYGTHRLTWEDHIDDEGNESTRSLGLIVARGTLLVLVSPADGSEEIANPFAQAEDD